MRVIGGIYRGRALVAPAGGHTRPTSDRVREALFNILSHGISGNGQPPLPQGARVLDLFAGSGALGFEALSRGAARVLFVDNATGARAAIRQNIETLQAAGVTKLYRRDATSLGPMESNCGGPFDLVFLDPPYHSGFIKPALNGLRDGGWLNPGAILVVEMAVDETLAEIAGYNEIDCRTYGDTKLVFVQSAS